jgi:hypothetical protein
MSTLDFATCQMQAGTIMEALHPARYDRVVPTIRFIGQKML